MEKLENELLPIWEEIKNKAVVTFKDIEKINRAFEKAFSKLQRQRERLETSRDIWKGRYIKLKEVKKC